jgi:hypothetical protein
VIPGLLLVMLAASCGGSASPRAPSDSRSQDQIQWAPIRTWTGRGDQLLDSFQSDNGALKIDWEVKRDANATSPGSLKLVVHSAISGRPLAAPILDHSGEGKGTTYVSEEPRVFFLNVTSQDVEWKISVAERVR